jgi:phage anti-repressor protein
MYLCCVKQLKQKTMKNNVIKITKAQFIEMLKNWNLGCKPANIQYITEPKNLTKEGKQKFPELLHIAAVGAMIGYNYENSVNNQREREGIESDFQSKPLWNGKGKHINAVLATHTETNEFYLVYKYQQSFRSIFVNNYTPVPFAELKPFFKVSENKNQGTETIIHHRLIKISNIRKVKMNKQEFVID